MRWWWHGQQRVRHRSRQRYSTGIVGLRQRVQQVQHGERDDRRRGRVTGLMPSLAMLGAQVGRLPVQVARAARKEVRCVLRAYSDEFRHRFQFKPARHSDSNPPPFPIRFQHPVRMPFFERHQRRVVHGGGRASLATNARPPRWATRVQRAGCSCRPSPARFSLNSVLSRQESVISLRPSSSAWASSIRRSVRYGARR